MLCSSLYCISQGRECGLVNISPNTVSFTSGMQNFVSSKEPVVYIYISIFIEAQANYENICNTDEITISYPLQAWSKRTLYHRTLLRLLRFPLQIRLFLVSAV